MIPSSDPSTSACQSLEPDLDARRVIFLSESAARWFRSGDGGSEAVAPSLNSTRSSWPSWADADDVLATSASCDVLGLSRAEVTGFEDVVRIIGGVHQEIRLLK